MGERICPTDRCQNEEIRTQTREICERPRISGASNRTGADMEQKTQK